jgi:hypothetical protein
VQVQYSHSATIFHAYTGELHLRALHFDLQDDAAPPTSLFTAPCAAEAVLGRRVPYLVSVRVGGEWLWDAKAGSRADLKTLPRAALDRTAQREGSEEHRWRFWHVRAATAGTVVSVVKLLEVIQVRLQ